MYCLLSGFTPFILDEDDRFVLEPEIIEELIC